jgi:C1A family cysteine protease
LKAAIKVYPVSVAVDATNWNTYKQNTIFNNCAKSLNHAVLAVGYDANGNWIIKNSWGTTWGNKGFMTLAAGDTCGVT